MNINYTGIPLRMDGGQRGHTNIQIMQSNSKDGTVEILKNREETKRRLERDDDRPNVWEGDCFSEGDRDLIRAVLHEVLRADKRQLLARYSGPLRRRDRQAQSIAPSGPLCKGASEQEDTVLTLFQDNQRAKVKELEAQVKSLEAEVARLRSEVTTTGPNRR
eukprot:COSAG01_NODE_10178_length_2229_cov_4.487793_3_plen_162_part_00